MMNHNINDIFFPEFRNRIQTNLQMQPSGWEQQPEVLKVLRAVDEFCNAYKGVTPKYKIQARDACIIRIFDEIEKGTFNY